MSAKSIKILGFCSMMIGMGATLITDWVKDKQIEQEINEKIKNAINKAEK